MIRAVIVDDESHCRQSLEIQLKSAGNIEVVASCGNVESAQSSILSTEPDLVFLDVELSDSTGFELLKNFHQHEFDVIFTTAHNQYALQAIKASALDYLLKPISSVELMAAIQKHIDKRKFAQVGKQVEVLFEHYLNQHGNRSLALPTQEGLEFISLSEIIRLESDSNYTTFHLDSKRKIIVPKTLKDYEDLLSNNGFVRIHRSHMINLHFLEKYFKGDGGYVKMKDGSTAEVSRQRKEVFINMLNKA